MARNMVRFWMTLVLLLVVIVAGGPAAAQPASPVTGGATSLLQSQAQGGAEGDLVTASLQVPPHARELDQSEAEGAQASGEGTAYGAPAGPINAGGQAKAGTQGDPDSFGYAFLDSYDLGGPSATFEDISAFGRAVVFSDSYVPVNLPFAFPYYGAPYTQTYLYRNCGSGLWTHLAFGAPDIANALVWASDVDCASGAVYVYSDTLSQPARWIAQYDQVATNGYHDFYTTTSEVILYETGDILVRYARDWSWWAMTPYPYEMAAPALHSLTFGQFPYVEFPLDDLAVLFIYPTGARLWPWAQKGPGPAGTLEPYSVQLHNYTGLTTTFHLSAGGNSWPVSIWPIDTAILAPGQATTITVVVSIPASGRAGERDAVHLQAASATTPTVTATAVLTTSVPGPMVYASVIRKSAVLAVDTLSHAVVDTIDVSAAGCDVANWLNKLTLTPDGEYLWAYCGTNSIGVIDTAQNALVDTIPNLWNSYNGAFTRDGDYVLVDNESAVELRDARTLSLVATIPLCAPSGGCTVDAIAIHPFLDQAYAACDNHLLQVLDLDALTVTAVISLTQRTSDLAVSPDGRWAVIVSDGFGYTGVDVVDLVNNTFYTHTMSSMGLAYYLEFDADSSHVFVSHSYGIHALDGTTFRPVNRTPPYTTGIIDLACGGDELYVGPGPFVMTIDPRTYQITGRTQVAHRERELDEYLQTLAACPPVRDPSVGLPPAQGRPATPGEMVQYDLHLSNHTGRADRFLLSVADNSWTTTLSLTDTGTLSDGVALEFTVHVQAPLDAPPGDLDQVTVYITSATSPTVYSDTTALTTTIYGAPEILVPTVTLACALPPTQTTSLTLSLSSGAGMTVTFGLTDVQGTGRLLGAPKDLPTAETAFGPTGPTAEDRPDAVPPAPRTPIPRAWAEGSGPTGVLSLGRPITQTTDNEDNDGSGQPDGDMDAYMCMNDPRYPFEFNIWITGSVGVSGNLLTVRAFDVDPAERARVWLNGYYVGNLAGASDAWSETTFSLLPHVARSGLNRLRINQAPWTSLCLQVDWGAMFATYDTVPWLSEMPTAGQIPPERRQDTHVSFDSTGLEPGRYRAEIVVESNDPDRPLSYIPVQMMVLPDANSGWIEGTVRDSYTGDPLSVTLLLSTPLTVTTEPGTGYMAFLPAGRYTMTVALADYLGQAIVMDIQAGQGTVRDVALVRDVPIAAVAPESIAFTMTPGESASQLLTVDNDGPAQLDYFFHTGLTGTSFFLASTVLYGYDVPETYLRVVATMDDTYARVVDLESGAVLAENPDLDRGEEWNIYPVDGTAYKVEADRPVLGYEFNESWYGSSTFIPSLSSGPVGTEFEFYYYRTEAFYLFAMDNANIWVYSTTGELVTTTTVPAGQYGDLELADGFYHITSTGRIAMATMAGNGYTTVPSVDGTGTGHTFYFATSHYVTGALAVLAYEDSQVKLYDMDSGEQLYTRTVAAGSYWFQEGLGARRLRLESTGEVEVWAGDTEGGSGIEWLGDDISFAGGREGKEFYVHSLMTGTVVFAPFATVVTIDGVPYPLNKDQYLVMPGCCFYRHITADRPILVETIGGANMWNDAGTYLGGVTLGPVSNVPWLSVETTRGSVPGYGEEQLLVTLDSTGLVSGTYTATLFLASNAWLSASVAIPVVLNVVPDADLSVGKVAPALADVGDLLTYVITYSNAGSLVAESVLLTDTLPVGIVYLSDTAPFSHTGSGSGPIVWEAGSWPIGTRGSFTVTAVLNSGEPGALFTNTVEVGSETPDGTLTNNRATAATRITCLTLTAAFTMTPPAAMAGQPVTMVQQSSGNEPFSFLWAFGDGGTSTLRSPVHVFAMPGVYTVTMTVVDPCGQEEVAERSIMVQPAVSVVYLPVVIKHR